MTRPQQVALCSAITAAVVLMALVISEPVEREIRRTLRCIRGGKR